MPRLFDLISEDEIFHALLAQPKPEGFSTVAEFSRLTLRMIECGIPTHILSGTMAALIALDNYIRHNWKGN